MISPTATGPHPHLGQRSKERGPPWGEGRTLGWVDRVLGSGPDSSSPSPPTHHVLRASPMSSPLVLTWTLCRRVLVITLTAQAAEAQGREGPGVTWLRRIRQSHRVPEPGGPWRQCDRHADLRCGTRSPKKLGSLPQIAAQSSFQKVINGLLCTLRQTWPLPFRFLNFCPSMSSS